MKHLLTFMSVFAVGLAVLNTPVLADGTNTESNTESKVECTTGSYGQNVNCTATASAKTKQTVVRKDGTVVTTHKTADTSLDARTLTLVAGTFATGIAGAVIRYNTKA